MKNLEELRSTFQKIDEKTYQAEADLKKLKAFIREFKKMEANRKELSEYYHTDWLEESEQFHSQVKGEAYYSTNQDAIWNVLQDLYQEKIKLLKMIAKTI